MAWRSLEGSTSHEAIRAPVPPEQHLLLERSSRNRPAATCLTHVSSPDSKDVWSHQSQTDTSRIDRVACPPVPAPHAPRFSDESRPREAYAISRRVVYRMTGDEFSSGVLQPVRGADDGVMVRRSSSRVRPWCFSLAWGWQVCRRARVKSSTIWRLGKFSLHSISLTRRICDVRI